MKFLGHRVCKLLIHIVKRDPRNVVPIPVVKESGKLHHIFTSIGHYVFLHLSGYFCLHSLSAYEVKYFHVYISHLIFSFVTYLFIFLCDVSVYFPL